MDRELELRSLALEYTFKWIDVLNVKMPNGLPFIPSADEHMGQADMYYRWLKDGTFENGE